MSGVLMTGTRPHHHAARVEVAAAAVVGVLVAVVVVAPLLLPRAALPVLTSCRHRRYDSALECRLTIPVPNFGAQHPQLAQVYQSLYVPAQARVARNTAIRRVVATCCRIFGVIPVPVVAAARGSQHRGSAQP